MRRRWREPAAIAAEIDRIRSLRLDAVRREWRLVFGRVPPAGLSKDLLGRMIAARLGAALHPVRGTPPPPRSSGSRPARGRWSVRTTRRSRGSRRALAGLGLR
jgi:hypothetical protein